ncbi:MAG: hypothetical protein HYX38_11775 [Rhodospirillales bacterium]|nr:hypothetical protein [Rhodospirillales bacterium]
MPAGGLQRLLEESRWRPYQVGGLLSLPIIAVMALLWVYFEIGAFVWLCLYPWWSGLDVFWKTPRRKMISTALLLGTVVPLLVVLPMLYGSNGLRRQL